MHFAISTPYHLVAAREQALLFAPHHLKAISDVRRSLSTYRYPL